MGRDQNAEHSLQTVRAFAQAMMGQHTLDELLWHIAELVGELLGFDDCVIYMRQGDVLIQTAAFGPKNPATHRIKEPLIIPVGEGIVGTVARTGEAEYIPNTQLDPRYISDQYQGVSELTVPVVFEDRVICVFDSESDVPDGFTEFDRAQFQLIADMASARIAWLLSERLRLASMKRQDADRLRSLGVLAGGIAHDFNNLLAVVALNTEITRCAADEETRTEALKTIDEVTNRASGLTKQLVTFSRGGAPFRELIRAGPLLQEAVRFLRGMPEVVVDLQMDTDLPLLNADGTQLSQVLHNLLLNAAEAMGGRGRIWVSVQPTLHDGTTALQIDVRDNGPGMDEQLMAQVFNPYFSTKNRDSGLGLAISFWIVSRHDGELTATSRLGEGTTFSMVLPALTGKLPRRTAKKNHPPLPPLRVLVLEDDPLVGRGLTALLRKRGHLTEVVSDGVDIAPAWAKAIRSGNEYDVALLDLQNAGGMGGLEAMSELLRVDGDARALVMSGYTDGKGMMDYQRLGFRARLEKPFDLEKLIDALRTALE